MTVAAAPTHRFEAMASAVHVQLAADVAQAPALFRAVEAVFSEVEHSCTRFDPDSPLMQANAAGHAWFPVPPMCWDVLREAYRAYQDTGGRFDPRILSELHRLGYRDTFSQVVDRDSPLPAGPKVARGTWRPEFRDDPWAVRIGPHPVDLGGIGKGVALRKAAALIAAVTADFLIEAGGDCYLGGRAPDGSAWSVAVEDPLGGDRPRAVLAVTDAACATSSTRLRRWRNGNRVLHHLIDPRTGEPADDGLVAVTVISRDPAVAEVNTKLLFLAGVNSIEQQADELGLPALWIDASGGLGFSSALVPHLLWWSQ